MSYSLFRPRKDHKHWTVRIRLPGQPPIERSTGCTLKRDARAVAERLHSEAAAGLVRVPLVEALGALIVLRSNQRRSAATIEKVTEKGAQLLAFFGEDRDVLRLKLDDTSRYVAHRRASPRRPSDSTIAMELTVLMSALGRLRRREVLPYDPKTRWPEEIEPGAGEVRDRWLPWPEYLRVLAAIRAEWRDAFVIYCAMGLRFSELYTLHASDLSHDADGGLLVRVRGTKTKGAVRTVPANPDAAEVLQRRAQEHPTGALFPVDRRGGLESQKAAWARACRDAAHASRVAHFSSNDLRRTFASRAFQAGVAEPLLIKWMGHHSSAMVRRVYAQASSEQHAAEVAKLPSRRAAKKSDKAGKAEEG